MIDGGLFLRGVRLQETDDQRQHLLLMRDEAQMPAAFDAFKAHTGDTGNGVLFSVLIAEGLRKSLCAMCPLRSAPGYRFTAMHSISNFAPLGKSLTATVDRAGGVPVKNSA